MLFRSVYETAPQKFFDGQLNIPEKANGIPDILDEALWALKIWQGLQRPDGAVRHGTESAGDPDFVQTVELDNKGDFAWAADSGSSFEFAGAMAQASRLLRPFRPELADNFLDRARRAYRWAAANRPPIDDLAKFGDYYICPRAYAAAELLHTTGEDQYNLDFLVNTPWYKQSGANMIQYRKYDLSAAAYSYANLPEDRGDPIVKNAVRNAILREADMYIDGSEAMAYRFVRHPYAPITWGTGAYETHLVPVWQAWRFTHSPKYFDWIVRTCDNTLGANPLNLSWVVGIGTRTVRAPLHNSRYNSTGMVVTGQQVQGPNANGDGYAYRDAVFPAHSDKFAVLYSFADMHFAIQMDEGTVSNQVRTLAAFALLLPDRKSPENSRP